jgi:hypothetical protein
MAISSFTANRLASIITQLSDDTLGVEGLRAIAKMVHDIRSEIANAPNKVIAEVLWNKLDRICEHYEAEPMPEEESRLLVTKLKTVVIEALRYIAKDKTTDADAVRLSVQLISFAVDN